MTTCVVAPHFRVDIPTGAKFLEKWHSWVHAKVQNHFKRDKSRVADTAQNVRLRLLRKEFIPRWFYKHLTDELVDRSQVEVMLGASFNKTLEPAFGDAKNPDALWRVRDVLAYAKFDYDRYFYSIQRHTIDSDKVLRLLGYAPGQYEALKSLWRSNILLPAELTEHEGCPRRENKALRVRECEDCAKGLDNLMSRGLSVASQYDWSLPEVAARAAKLRWNDSQLAPLLRGWKNANMIKSAPHYIMRTNSNHGIDAGLLEYAQIIIDNEVVNDFKRLTRNDDIEHMVFNKHKSPELPNSETMAWDGEDENDKGQRILRDPDSLSGFAGREVMSDLELIRRSSVIDTIVARKLERAKNDPALRAQMESLEYKTYLMTSSRANTQLTLEERRVIQQVDIGELSVKDYAEQCGKSVQYIHKIHASALVKLQTIGGQAEELTEEQSEQVDRIYAMVLEEFGVSSDELCGKPHPITREPMGRFGRPVLARTKLFSALHEMGISVMMIAREFDVDAEKVVAAINRAHTRLANTGSDGARSAYID